MKQKQRRSTVCHNCSSPLEEAYNFCPTCGQSNTDNNITFWTLMKEFVDNYLGLDSKMAHSVIPFLTNPGALTNRFNEGRIKHFIHPVRLYLVMSLFYFFTISYLLSGFDLRNFEDEADLTSASIDEFKKNERLLMLDDSTKLKLFSDSIVSKYTNIESFDQLYDSLNNDFNTDEFEDLSVSLKGIDIPESDEEGTIDRLHRLARDRRITDEAFLDSLTGNDNPFDTTFFNISQEEHLSGQLRKIFENDQGFKSFVLGNLPLTMFILIPLFAGILKLLYVRREHLYIKHVVHALHIHSFFYLLFGLGLLIIFKLIGEDVEGYMAYRGITAVIFFIVTTTYAYISFLKVYKQGWFKTLIKFWLVGFTYSFFLNTFFFMEVMISFWYY